MPSARHVAERDPASDCRCNAQNVHLSGPLKMPIGAFAQSCLLWLRPSSSSTAGHLLSAHWDQTPVPPPRSLRLPLSCSPQRSHLTSYLPAEMHAADLVQREIFRVASYLIREHSCMVRRPIASNPAVSEPHVKASRSGIPGSSFSNQLERESTTPASGANYLPSFVWTRRASVREHL